MREFKFSAVRIIHNTRIYRDHENLRMVNYENSSIIYTKNGIVKVIEIDWQTNSGRIRFSVFEKVIGKKVFRAEIDEARFSDRCLKWLATNFINKCINTCPKS